MRVALIGLGAVVGCAATAAVLADWRRWRRRSRTRALERSLQKQGVPLGSVNGSGWILGGRR